MMSNGPYMKCQGAQNGAGGTHDIKGQGSGVLLGGLDGQASGTHYSKSRCRFECTRTMGRETGTSV